MHVQDRIDQAFASLAVKADPAGMPLRTHLFQQPSDSLRDSARAFAKQLIGLVPDPAYHDKVVDALHDLVVLGERTLQTVLERSDEWRRDGSKVSVTHADYRLEQEDALLSALADKDAELVALRRENDDLTERLEAAMHKVEPPAKSKR